MEDAYVDSSISFQGNDFGLNKAKEIKEKKELFRNGLREYIFNLCKEKHSFGDENIKHIEDLIENFISTEIVDEHPDSDFYNGDYFLSSFFHEGFEPDMHDCDKFTDEHDYVLSSFINFELQKARKQGKVKEFEVNRNGGNMITLDYIPKVLHEKSHEKIDYFVSNLRQGNLEENYRGRKTSNGLPTAN